MAIENAGEVVFQGGPAGLDGQSTYQAWLALGNTGSLADFMAAQRGATGPANALAIGTVATGAPGSSASATITGAAPNQTLNLSVPQGATGAQSWQTPPTPWVTNTAYTATAPASSVTYGGESYVCTASHTSGAAFDASKWVKIAQKGADGSPSAGAVLYNGPQSLEAQSRRQAKVNIRTPECDYTYNTAAQQLTADHDGKLILVDADTVQTLPQGSTFPYGGAITLRSVNGIPFTVAAYGSDGINLAGPSVASFRVYPGGEARLYWTGFQWNGANLAPVAAALLNDRAQAFTDAQKQQLLANADLAIPHCQGRLTYDANFQIALRVAVGNKIFINGNYRTIPAGGVTLSNNVGLSASTVYYVYAFLNAGTMALAASGAPPAFDPVYGHKVISNQGSDAGNRVYTYVGMIYVGADGKFVDNPAFRGVVTAYNKRFRSVAGSSFSASTASTSQVELSTAARVYVLIEAGTSLLGSVFGWGGTSNAQPGYGMFVAASLDGDNVAPAGLASKAAYGDGSLPSGYAWDPSEGLHYLTAKGSAPSGGTGNFTGSVSGMVWM